MSQPNYSDAQWYAAVVPGTVLTTLIARGVYPDPDFGLNNLAIPDTLSRQAYWYRSEFLAPDELRDRELTLTFKGINYAAEVWLNGRRLGTIKGAFTRGIFDVTGLLQPGRAMRSRCESLRRRIRGFRTSNPSRPAPARTAGRSRSMARLSSRPRVGTGSQGFATVTRAYGKASSSRQAAACASSIHRS